MSDIHLKNNTICPKETAAAPPVNSTTSNSSKRQEWSLDELKELIKVCTDVNFWMKKDVQPCKNVSAYTKIQTHLVHKNFSRNKKQLYGKIKELRKAYEILKSTLEEELSSVLHEKKYYAFLYDFVILKKLNDFSTAPNDRDAEKENVEEQINDEDKQSLSNHSQNLNYSDSHLYTDEEIKDLIKICNDLNFYYFKDDKGTRNGDLYGAIHARMRENGSNKTKQSMITKINNLHKEYVSVKKGLSKSGAPGENVQTEDKPYWEEMNILFSRRPKSDTPSYDSLVPDNYQKLLQDSISQDNDTKTRFPKPPGSGMKNILTNVVQSSHKQSDLQLERFLKHDEVMEEKRCKFVAEVMENSTTALVNVLSEALKRNNPTHYTPQFPPQTTLGQYQGAFHGYPSMYPPEMSTNRNLHKRKKKSKERRDKRARDREQN